MISKVTILCAVFAAAQASGFYAGPIVNTGVSKTSRQQDAIGNYAFDYGIVDGLGASNSRAEVGDAVGNKKGVYTLTDIDGRARRVDYVADGLGFRASVKTNEPGTALSAPAAAEVISPYAGPVAPAPVVAAAPIAPVHAAPIVAAAPFTPLAAAPVFAAAPVAPIVAAAHPYVSTGISKTSRQQDAIGNYAFNYDIVDGLGASNSRAEVGDVAGNKKGVYTLTDIDGRARRVDYVADGLGFRASVKTNEPGTALSAPAAAEVISPYAGPVAPVAAAPVVAAAPLAPLHAAPIVPGPAAALLGAPATLSTYSTVIGHGAAIAAPIPVAYKGTPYVGAGLK